MRNSIQGYFRRRCSRLRQIWLATRRISRTLQANLNRYVPLLKQGFSTQQQVGDQAASVAQLRAAIGSDQAAIDNAQTQLSYTTITSPISGVTGIRRVDIGNIVQPTDATPIVTITQIQPISVIFTLPQKDLPEVQAAIRKGPLRAIAYPQDGTDALGEGSLLLVNNQISQASGTVELKATFANKNGKLWPGEFVQVRLVTSVQASAVSVPLSALQQGSAGQQVFVVGSGNTVHLQPVKITETLDGRALVSDGLKAGDTVVTSGQYRLAGRHGNHCDAHRKQRRAKPDAGNSRNARMSLSSAFIRRPVATALFIVAIVLLGGTAYTMLPVAALPNVSFPTISVTAQLPGADPKTMASSVATPLEKQFGEIPYLTQMTSTSSLGYTSITLQFALNDDINAAAQLVQAAINAASGQLPKDMPTPPVYHETNPADAPILVLGLTSTTLPITTVDDYTESILAQKLSQVPGVGLITIGGEQHPAIRLQIDPVKLAAAGLDLEQVRSALTNISVDQPKGTLYGNTRSYALQTNDQLLNPKDWDNQIIAYRNGGPIRVSDVGQAVIGPQDKTLGGWVNQDQGVVLAIQRLPGANVISTVQRHQGVAAAADVNAAAGDQGNGDFRPHHHHSRVGVRRSVHAAADGRAGGGRDLRFPAQPVGDNHSRDRRSGVHHRHFRCDVSAELQPGQPVADGPLDRGWVRGGRCDRHGRKHRAAYRDGQETAASRARRCG